MPMRCPYSRCVTVGSSGGRMIRMGLLCVGWRNAADGGLEPRPLLRFGQAARLGQVVVEAMETEIPVPREHRVTDLREVLENGEVDVHGAADPVPVEHIQHPPEADAVAVVAGRIRGN